MNPLKYKKKQDTSFLQPIDVPSVSQFDKFNVIHHNQNKKSQQPLKLQRSYREPRILIKKDRYESLDSSMERKQQIRSLSIRRSSQQTEKNIEKFILFKRPVRNKTNNSSIGASKPQVNLRTDRYRRPSQNKKLTIVDSSEFQKQDIDSQSLSKKQLKLMNRLQGYEAKKSESKSKFRVKSTFTKMNSNELVNSASQKSSAITLANKQRSTSNSKIKFQQFLQKIKLLIKSEKFKDALSLIKRCFSQNESMDHPELLQLFAISMYNLHEYLEVTKIAEKMFLQTFQFSSQLYVMVCLSYAKIKSYAKALQVIQKGAMRFPQNAEIFYYKGKILYHTKKYSLAQEAFLNSLQICFLPQTLICLVDCYTKSNNKDEEIKTLDKIIKMKNSDFSINWQSFLVRKLKIWFEMEKYDQILTQINTFEKILNESNDIEGKSEVLLMEALCRYKKMNNQGAYEKFEDCIVSEYFVLESLKMMIVIEIKEKNFYEASHLCGQVLKKGVKAEQDDLISFLLDFVEGSISLVRRNFKQGIERLAKVELALDNKKELSRFKEVQKWKEYEDIQNFQVYKTVKQLIHLFLAYGLFCTREFKYCQAAINRQKMILNDPVYAKGLEYNFKLCEAILAFQDGSYSLSLGFLQQADQIFPQRLQVLFYKAVVLIQLFCTSESCQIKHELTSEERDKMAQDIKQNFEKALTKVSSTANNTKATIYYYKSLFHAYLSDWKQSLVSIQEAINKSQDTYWRYYYTKGLLLACIHNFQQAITELTAAINFSEGSRADCFLLRSKCLQIEARGNEAFYDLQQYIALRPDDQDVHMYAGQLLFQNGAFQDALTAFQHKQIPLKTQNYDIFLTLAKTLFLTGKFNSAQQKMIQAHKLQPTDPQVLFDAKIINFLGKLIDSINSNTLKETEKQLASEINKSFCGKNNTNFGKIFRQPDLFLMQALIAIYSGDHLQAVEHFKKHLSEKRKLIIFEDSSNSEPSFLQNKSQDDLEKTTNQLKIYTNQMKYNIVLCYLVGGDLNSAKQVLKDIKIDQNEAFYLNFCKFRSSIISQSFTFEKEEVLPNKNKLSQFLPSFSINLKSKKTQVKLKLCIPFPKVQPPEIFPTFDKKLLKTLSLFGIEGKPEAPWIVKEDNVIKFTQKISYASRLDFNDSQPSNSRTVIIDLQDSRAEQKNRLQTKSNDRSSMFSKRTLKKMNSITLNFT